MPEPELRMIELRKKNEEDLTKFIQTMALVVRQGSLKATARGDIVQLAGAGELIGPEIQYAGTSTSMIAAKSLLPEITVCVAPHAVFARWMQERPSLNEWVLRDLARHSLENRMSYHWCRKSLRERAVLVLDHLRERFGVRYGQFRMIDLPLTKIDLASLMSTVQESAVRVLSEFREDGLISANGKRIVILDNDRLDRMRDEIFRANDEFHEMAEPVTSTSIRVRD